MGFSGLAPEVINGRAAMIGFVCAFSAELRAGESVFSQMVSGGFVQMLMVILAVSVASFAPAVRQVGRGGGRGGEALQQPGMVQRHACMCVCGLGYAGQRCKRMQFCRIHPSMHAPRLCAHTRAHSNTQRTHAMHQRARLTLFCHQAQPHAQQHVHIVWHVHRHSAH